MAMTTMMVDHKRSFGNAFQMTDMNSSYMTRMTMEYAVIMAVGVIVYRSME